MKHLHYTLLQTLPNMIGEWACDCGVEPGPGVFE